jgi:prefoldin subunit 5
MSVEKLEEEVEKLQDEMEELEENCDSLDICKEDDGCSKCDAYKKMEANNLKIEELENKIEELTAAEETED